MIVLVVMALALGLAGPRVSKQMTLLHLRTTAKKIAASLRWAHSQALSTGKTYNVVFDCGGGRLIISDYAAAPEPEAPGQAPAGQDSAATENEASLWKPELKVFELPDDIYFSRVEIGDVIDANPDRDRIYQMTFFPDGTSMGGEILVADDQRRSYAIAVDFLTGMVSLEEPES